eukprot:2937431-Prymnesium_polylepis.1
MAIAGGGRTPGSDPTKILAFRSDALRNLIRVLQKNLYGAFTENELPRVGEQAVYNFVINAMADTTSGTKVTYLPYSDGNF